jgi:hypothetical protein
MPSNFFFPFFLKTNIETKGYYQTLELDGFGIQGPFQN